VRAAGIVGDSHYKEVIAINVIASSGHNMAQQKKESGEMKKCIAIVAVVVMVLSLGTVAAFAADSYPFDKLETTQSAVNLTEDNTGKAATTIPVYGYVGVKGPVTDNKPKDPDTRPEVGAINVSVPTKLFWAAFEGDTGITAPSYKITNSAKENVDVELTSFTSVGGIESNEYVDKDLNLTIVNTTATANVFGTTGKSIAVVKKADYLESSEKVALGTLAKETGEWNFTFGGTYDATFPDEAKTPKYNMVLTFSINKTA
jgi:hypothetical protein